MSPLFLLRLGLDFLAFGLFIFAMAYWWMDNRAHELVGTGVFALLFLHNVFNRRWYGGIPRTRRQARPLVTVVLNLALLATMVTLLTTSVLISQSLFSILAVGGPTARDIHILATYWALIVASIHLGLHWSIAMNVVRSLLRISGTRLLPTARLRLASVGIAVGGIYSSLELDIGSRLLLIPTMQFGDFNENAAGFFLRIAAISGLYVSAGHYGILVIQALQHPAGGRGRSEPHPETTSST